MARLLWLVVLASSCDLNFFEGDYPHDVTCSSDGTCPPGQTCVPWENRCRLACKTPGPCHQSNGNNQCECRVSLGNMSANEECDTDHFCRPQCGGSTCGVPSSSCDPTFDVCRPPCGAGGSCPGDSVCATISTGSALCFPPNSSLPDGSVVRDAGPDDGGDGGGSDGAVLDGSIGPVVLATGLNVPQFVAVGAGRIYYDNARTAILSCRPGIDCGGVGTIIVNTLNPTGLMAFANSVWWATLTGDVNICPSTGCPTSSPIPLAQGQTGAATLVRDANNNLYWTTSQGGVSVIQYANSNLGGGPITTVVSGQPGSSTSLATDGTSVFWTNGDDLWSCATAGCTQPKVVTHQAQPLGSIILVGSRAVFTVGDCIYTCDPVGSCQVGLVACNGGAQINGIASNGTNVYWTLATEVRSCSVTACVPTTIAAKQPGPMGIAVDQATVYWVNTGTSSNTGQVLALPQ